MEKNRTSSAAQVPPLSARLSGTKRAAFWVTAALVGGMVLWGIYAPIGGAAVASGEIDPDSNVRIVQHLEGGIVSAVRIREGQEVQAGSVLFELTDADARAQAIILDRRLFELDVQRARLNAMASGSPFDVTRFIERSSDDLERLSFVQTQQTVRATRLAGLNERIRVINDQITQAAAVVSGVDEQIRALDTQHSSVKERLVIIEDLFSRGLKTRSDVMVARENSSQLYRERAGLRTERDRSLGRIEELRGIIAAERANLATEIAQELNRVEGGRAQTLASLEAARDKVQRSLVRATTDGQVTGLQVSGVGAVVKPGEPLARIVPIGDDPVVVVQLSPRDVAFVNAGMPAKVMLSAYSTRTTPLLPATVRTVSADVETDDRTGARYYRTDLTLDRAEIEKLAPGLIITPGMPAEAFIQTVERTLFDYLADPITQSLRRALRET